MFVAKFGYFLAILLIRRTFSRSYVMSAVNSSSCTMIAASGEMYDHLVSDSSVALKWLCDSCEKLVMDKNFTSTPNTTSTSSACQN